LLKEATKAPKLQKAQNLGINFLKEYLTLLNDNTKFQKQQRIQDLGTDNF